MAGRARDRHAHDRRLHDAQLRRLDGLRRHARGARGRVSGGCDGGGAVREFGGCGERRGDPSRVQRGDAVALRRGREHRRLAGGAGRGRAIAARQHLPVESACAQGARGGVSDQRRVSAETKRAATAALARTTISNENARARLRGCGRHAQRRTETQRVEHRFDEPFGIARHVERVGQDRHVAQRARDERMQHARGARRVEVGGQLALGHRVAQAFLDAHQPLAHIALMARHHRAHFLDEFALQKQDLEHAAAARVAGRIAQTERAQILDAPERVGLARIDRGGLEFVERQDHTVEHRREQIALVLEMPVDRAARHAGGLRNVGKRCARNAFFKKDVFGGVENAVARLQRFLFRASGHDRWNTGVRAVVRS
ncbi:hypothetical protein PT2222_270088 [Paraburkholderia tropica]